ncbi:nicotinate-nucleotide adenylyltransferase [Chengkuizengella axinellae]|uniref:Probable nicotinate-nucleotide adenylyltransferase n=1 Tax=Chengkuizengella axinellae TaxID=3064388 RepID=A0ABT9IVD8_9BACL|nr:nicotinate-nucleotide adenylyltransferase [Chengkuizengella sp. 2205SS18-9]MDP5273032.1 nicotinate-nucleotide adenylyltransferase [Chengkuizengella sp. 2205SS18-9]
MKVGIMGGTFDPIHLGHMIIAEKARIEMDLQEVWFMPSSIPPHKRNTPVATPIQRWQMVCEAVESNDYFFGKDLELKREGISYTIDTVKALKQSCPHHEFFFIIGGDMIQYLPHWHQVDELIGLISFIGLKRPGTEIQWDELSAQIKQKITLIPMPLIDISSTEIRSLAARNKSIRYLVQDKVYDYIKEHKLYETRSSY